MKTLTLAFFLLIVNVVFSQIKNSEVSVEAPKIRSYNIYSYNVEKTPRGEYQKSTFKKLTTFNTIMYDDSITQCTYTDVDLNGEPYNLIIELYDKKNTLIENTYVFPNMEYSLRFSIVNDRFGLNKTEKVFNENDSLLYTKRSLYFNHKKYKELKYDFNEKLINWSNLAYDSLGRLKECSHYKVVDFYNGVAENKFDSTLLFKEVYFYTNNGNRLHVFKYDNQGIISESTTNHYRFDKYNNWTAKSEIIKYYSEDDITEVRSVYEREITYFIVNSELTDLEVNNLSKNVKSVEKTSYSVWNQGKETKLVEFPPILNSHTKHEFNRFGNIVKLELMDSINGPRIITRAVYNKNSIDSLFSYSNGIVTNVFTYTYITIGELYWKEEYGEDGVIVSKELNKFNIEGELIQTNAYDSKDSLISSVNYDYHSDWVLMKRSTIYFKSNKNIIEHLSYNRSQLKKNNTFVYQNGKLKRSSRYKFNGKGLLVEDKRFSYNSKGKATLEVVYSYKYQCDLMGNWIELKEFEDRKLINLYKREVTYYEQ